MLTDTNEQRVLRAFDAIAHGGEEAFADRFVHASYRNHEAQEGVPGGPESFTRTARNLRSAFADLSFHIHDVISAGDKVVIRCQFSGRQVGSFAGLPVTGRRFSVQHIHIFRLLDGKLVEHWANRDDAGAMRQLGLLSTQTNGGRSSADQQRSAR